MRIFAFARSSASEEKEIPTVFFGFFSFIGSKLATFFQEINKIYKNSLDWLATFAKMYFNLEKV